MSNIYAINDLTKNNWSVDFDNLSAFYAYLNVEFIIHAPVVQFDDFRFGYELIQNGKSLSSSTYPSSSSERIIRTDQKYLITDRLNNLIPDNKYQLYLWSDNRNVFTEDTFEFLIPRPFNPYDSWSWNSDKLRWEAPKPMPTDGNDYIWSESISDWTLVEDNNV